MKESNGVGFGLLVLVVALGGLATGCGSEACEEADTKLESECGYDIGEPASDVECSGKAECTAECVLDSCGCEDLEGTVGEASGPCMECLLNCEAD